jgi:hypothetical protein
MSGGRPRRVPVRPILKRKESPSGELDGEPLLKKARTRSLDDIKEFMNMHSGNSALTHTSFKGGRDEFCQGEGTWSFPRDKEQELLECMAEVHDFGEPQYVVERKSAHFRYAEDIDIWGDDALPISEPWRREDSAFVLLEKLVQVRHDQVAGRIAEAFLDVYVFQSSGISRKHEKNKSSYHLVWPQIVLSCATNDAKKLCENTVQRMKRDFSEEEAWLKRLDDKNCWEEVFDKSVMGAKGSLRMPFCDKYHRDEGRSEDRPKMPVGWYRVHFPEDGAPEVEVKAQPADLSTLQWLQKGSLRVSDESTPVLSLYDSASDELEEPMAVDVPAHGELRDTADHDQVKAFIERNWNVCVSTVKESADGSAIFFNLKKSPMMICPFIRRPHKSNTPYFVFWPRSGVLQCRCHDADCEGMSHEHELPAELEAADSDSDEISTTTDWRAGVETLFRRYKRLGKESRFFRKAILLLNEHFAVIHESKAVIVERTDAGWMHRGQGPFLELYTNVRYFGKKLMSIWIESAGRRRFTRIVFNPRPQGMAGCATLLEFNLYEGLPSPTPIPEVEECIAPFLDHVRTVWCKGEQGLFDYVMNYFAHIIQKPWEKTGVAIVVHGEQGSGKGIVVQKIGKIVGRHFKHVGDFAEVLGKFNASVMKDPILLFLDEVSWGGNRKDGGILKKLITEPTHRIEEKFMPSITVDSYVNCIIASNEDWIVSYAGKERRFLVLDTNNRHAGPQTPASREYFATLDRVPPAAVAQFLYQRDISDFHPQEIPYSRAAQLQKEQSLDSVGQWWLERLREGSLSFSSSRVWCALAPTGSAWPERPQTESKQAMHGEYKSSTSRPVSDSLFWKKMQKLVWQDDAYKQAETRSGGVRQVTIPPLEQCREAFQKYMNDPHWSFE